jgi:gliding motility-associated-like protein
LDLKRFILKNIPCSKKYIFLSNIFLFLISLNFSFAQKVLNFGQIKVVNPCAIDLSTLPGLGTPPPSGSTPPVDPRSIYYTATTFMDENPNSTSWSWDFGDGTPIQTGKIVQHQYEFSGTYTVTLNGTQSFLIPIANTPKIPYFFDKYDTKDTTLCDNLTLDPYKKSVAPSASSVSYLWYPNGDTSPTLAIDKTDVYSVKVTDNTSGCFVYASASITICGSQPLSAEMEYHFGNDIIRKANHGNAQFATEFPIDVTYQGGGVLNTNLAASSVANPNKYHYQRYMFSTDGNELFGSNGQVIASNLSGPSNNPLQTVIVPKFQGDSSATTEYYILTVNKSGSLSYTLIDGRPRQEGDAIVIEKNVSLMNNMTGKIAVSKYFTNGSLSAYFIVTAGKDGNYYTYKITRNGLEGPTMSAGVGAGKIEIGQLKFSPDGTKLISAISAPPDNQIQICNFDSTSGNISGCVLKNVGSPSTQLYGLEYSPDGNFIYYTLSSISGGTSEFRRFDVTNDNTMLIQKATKGEVFGALKAVKIPGDEVEILMAVDGEKYLASLQRPNGIIINEYLVNDADTTVAYRQDKLKFKLEQYSLTGAKSTINLNNYVELPANSSPSSDAMTFKNDCVNEDIAFKATPQCQVTPISYEWNFGDGSATETGQNVSHAYKKAGNYTVTLFITYCSKPPVQIKDIVIVVPKPETDLLPLYENCFKTDPNFSVQVKITNIKDLEIYYPNQLLYEWAGPNITSSITKNKVTVNKPAKLELKVDYGHIFLDGTVKTCSDTFKTNITEFCPPVIVVPDVFTPNGDTSNERLEIKMNDEVDVDNYEFRIYNRWGELVYFTNKLVENWDGKFNNKECQADAYAWTVKYRSKYKPKGITYKNQGALLLVR